MNENNIHIIDYLSRITPDVSGSMRDPVPNFDFASLYPTPLRSRTFNSIVKSESIKTAEDLIDDWEEGQERSLWFGEMRFPEVQQVVARTFESDIVPVQPMQAPQGNLLYLDYVYAGQEEESDEN